VALGKQVKYNLGDEVTVLIKGTVTGTGGNTVCQVKDEKNYHRTVECYDEVTLIKPNLDKDAIYLDDLGSVWGHGQAGFWYRLRTGKGARFSDEPDFATFQRLVPEAP